MTGMIPKEEIIVSKHSWSYFAKVGVGLVASIYAGLYCWRLAMSPAYFDLRYLVLFLFSAYWIFVLLKMLLRHQVIRVGEERMLVQRPAGIAKIDRKDYGTYWEEPSKVQLPWNSLAGSSNRLYCKSKHGKSFVLSEGVYENYWELRNSIVHQFQEGSKDHFKRIRNRQEHGYRWLLVLIGSFFIWGFFTRITNKVQHIDHDLISFEATLGSKPLQAFSVEEREAVLAIPLHPDFRFTLDQDAFAAIKDRKTFGSEFLANKTIQLYVLKTDYEQKLSLSQLPQFWTKHLAWDHIKVYQIVLQDKGLVDLNEALSRKKRDDFLGILMLLMALAMLSAAFFPLMRV